MASAIVESVEDRTRSTAAQLTMLHNQKCHRSFVQNVGAGSVWCNSPRSWGRSGDSMGNQQSDGDEEPVANAEQGDVPDEVGVQPSASSDVISSTRSSRAWIRLLPLLIVLVVILVFVFQNPKDVKVSIFTFSGRLPLSVALLGAVILGALMTLALGSVRIIQLRRQVQRKSRHRRRRSSS